MIDAVDQRSSPYPWARDARVIEFGARSGRFIADLLRHGHDRCITIAKPARQSRDQLGVAPPLQERVVALETADWNLVRRNNGNVLVLHGRWGLSHWNWRSVRHVDWVVLPLSARPSFLGAIGLALVHWMRGRYAAPQLIRSGSSGQRLLAWRNRKPVAAAARRYVPHRLGVSGFFQQLQQQGLQHAALRWFESLPDVQAGEDVDLLIADEALPQVDAILSSGPGVQPVDLYTETGLPGTDFRGLPYYAPHLAEQLLERAVDHKGVCRVPNARDHFLSLAYHALYHKGRSSGLSADGDARAKSKPTDHDYEATLVRLAPAANYTGFMNLKALDDFLESEGWRPSHDMLARLAPRNAWLRERLAQQRDSTPDNGLIVFILRQVGMARGGLERAEALVAGHGFDVIFTTMLAADDAVRAARAIRGGNWGKGPWPISGGPPAGFIVAHDRRPLKPTKQQLKRQPLIVNARSLCKDEIRDEFNRGVDANEYCNVIHSSDNAREAMDYVKCLSPSVSNEILRRIDLIEGESVVADFTKSGRRATIEVVRHRGGLAVRKMFKPNCLDHLEREVRILSELGGSIDCIPRLLDRGSDWLMIPYFDDVLRYRRSSGKLLPLETAKQAIQALRDVYDAGYAIVDASVDNLLVDRREGLKLFDFEFSCRYSSPPPRFEDGFDVSGCPADYSGPLPIQGSNSYERNWKPYVGLSLESLLHDPLPMQRAKRALYVAAHAYRYAPRRIRSLFRHSPGPSLQCDATLLSASANVSNAAHSVAKAA